MLKRSEVVAAARRVAQRLAANEAGVAPLKDKHVQRLATLKQRSQRKRRKATAARS
jgi:hypothetical protein